MDLITLSNRLKLDGQLQEVSGSAYLVQILDSVPLALNAKYYACICKDKANRRRAIEIFNRATRAAQEGKDLGATLDVVNKDLAAIACNKSRRRSLCVVDLAEFLLRELPPREYVLAPIIPTQGLAMLYAARGVGKTMLAMHMAYAVATGQNTCRWTAPSARPVLYIDGEMPAVTMQERFASIVQGYPAEPAPGYLRIITPDLQDRTLNLATTESQAAVEPYLEGVSLGSR